jgi:glucose-1-phosphate cytidylyltransferase
MIEIGNRPILWHIMKMYRHYGFNDFVIPVGYKGHQIKEFFIGYRDRYADFTIDLAEGTIAQHSQPAEDWRVTVVDTGVGTQTGGRVKRLGSHLRGRFMLTYGDGLADVDIRRLVEFHESHGRLATVTAVRPPARFGAMELAGDKVTSFAEKPQAAAGWINGGYFVLEPEVIDYIEGDDTSFERDPLERLTRDGQLMAFRHDGFWEPMDTQRDLDHLNSAWATGDAPWKVWNG